MRMSQIPLEELASLPTFAAITPSHGGDQIGFYWDKTGRFELYIMDLQTRQTRQITDGQAPRGLRAGFVWTRDDSAIIYARDVDGNEQHNLHRVDLAARTFTQLTYDAHTQNVAAAVAPDNASLAVMSNRAGQMNVFTLGLQTGEWTQLTHFRFPASAEKWSPDGQWLAVASNESQDLKNHDGYLVRADGSELKKVLSVRNGSQDALNDWHPDGRRLAVTTDAGGTHRPGVLDLATGDVSWFGHDGVEEYAQSFSRNGEWLAVLRNQDSTITPVLYRVSTGEERRLNLPPGLATGSHFVLGDTKLLVQHTAANRRAELLLYDLASNTYETLMPAEYGSIDPSIFVMDEYVRYPSGDGVPVPAILYKPKGARAGDRLPALINVHGGPTAQWFRGFDPYAQFLVDRGFVVLEPNVRGSTGYGTQWRDANIKDWGGGDLEDVAAGADFLKTLDYVDPDRIGIFGGSYGGYMSFIAVVKKPDHFKVGVPMVGISDLHALYNESMEHFKYYLHQQMGDPERNHNLWRDRSAVTHAEQLKAKLLILHGLNDPRCPVSQARLFRDRILALGKCEGPDADFEYHEFNEGHGPSGDVQGKIRNYRLLVDFLERRL